MAQHCPGHRTDLAAGGGCKRRGRRHGQSKRTLASHTNVPAGSHARRSSEVISPASEKRAGASGGRGMERRVHKA